MSVAEQVFINVGSAVIFAVLGAFAARGWERTRSRRRYGYIRNFIGQHQRVQIIASSIELKRFTFPTDGGQSTQTSPRNVLFMPMAEGQAIGTLISLLHAANPKVRVELVTANGFDPSLPIFAIGGPSVSAFSAKVLPAEFPHFKIEYPEARQARYDGHVFETRSDSNSLLTRDYGFVFLTRTARGAPCAVFCGVLAFGTAMAVDLFGSLPSQSEAAAMISNGQKGFMVAEGNVDGLEQSAVTLVYCRRLSA